MRLVVDPSRAGCRLDRFLLDSLVPLGRRQILALIEAGQVRKNGRRAAKGDRLAAGDVIECAEVGRLLPDRTAPAAEPEAPLHVIYEDQDLVVVDKPAGQPTQPLRAGEHGTLAAAILGRYPETRGLGRDPREPGLVQRLDVGTSGLLLVARHRESHARLVAALRDRRITKRYLALVAGRLEGPRSITLAIGHHPRDPRRMVTSGGRSPRPAATSVRPLELLGSGPEAVTLVEATALTGRMHQIRVHLAAVGHPLCGDPLYGGPPLAGIEHPFLHAVELELDQPMTGARLCLRAPLPGALAAVLSHLRGPAP